VDFRSKIGTGYLFILSRFDLLALTALEGLCVAMLPGVPSGHPRLLNGRLSAFTIVAPDGAFISIGMLIS